MEETFEIEHVIRLRSLDNSGEYMEVKYDNETGLIELSWCDDNVEVTSSIDLPFKAEKLLADAIVKVAESINR